jgi:hypothetical protein
VSNLDPTLNELKAIVTQFIGAMDGARVSWTIPRAPGKWSPSQLVEHVARIMEESANVAAGAPSKFPTMPPFLRPVLRAFVFRRILRREAFLRMTAIAAFDPPVLDGPPTSAAGCVRLTGALAQFDQACREREAIGEDVESTLFGGVPVADFAMFQALHVRHHLEQMPQGN